MFASARIKSADGKGSAKERLDRMCEARSCDELTAIIKELYGQSDADSPESAASCVMRSSFALLDEAVPDKTVYDFLKYKYDCCNIKIALKSRILKADYSNLYYPYGSVPADVIADAVKSGDYSAFPANMALAAPRSLEAYLAGGEARVIDIMNDRACFDDILRSAAKLSSPELSDYYAMRADIVNLLTYLRIQKQGLSEAATRSVIERSLVSGGKLPKELFFVETEPDLAIAEKYWGLCEFTFALKSIGTQKTQDITALERSLDELALAALAPLKNKQFGVEVPAYFIIMREYEMKNARLISSALRHKASREKITERLRTAYV